MAKRKYRDGTTMEEIIEDGWARGFTATQTRDELAAQGYFVAKELIIKEWVRLDEEMETYFEQQEELDNGV